MRRRWRLGTGIFVGLVGLAGRAEAMPTIAMPSPAAGAATDDLVAVRATVTSPFALTSVTATIGGVSGAMIAAGGMWAKQLDISALPVGPVTLTIAASDANGDTATTSVSIIHDHAPTLAIVTPAFSVARPNLLLAGTCTDADGYGCASIKVEAKRSGNASVFADLATVAAGTLTQGVSLAAYEGSAIDLRFTTTDTAGLSTSRTIQAYVESSPKLVAADTVDGNLLDFDSTRLLFVNEGGVFVKDRATAAVTNIGAGTPATEILGHLTTAGAAWTNGDRIGAITTARAQRLWRARGDWGVRQTDASTGPVYRQDLTTGDSTAVGSIVYGLGDVDPAGTLVYVEYAPSAGYRLHRMKLAGADTVISTSGSFVSAGGGMADGDTVVSDGRLSVGRGAIALTLAGVTTTISPSAAQQFGITLPYQSYRANDGWVAYNKVVGNALTAWTRAPDGTEALASALGDVYAIDGLSPTGEVVYDVRTFVGGAYRFERYISAAGPALPTAALPIGGANGLMRHVDGAWYELLGNTAFKVDPAGTDAPDAGPGDAGPDAAPDASDDDAGTDAGSSGSTADAGIQDGSPSGASSSSSGDVGSPGSPGPGASNDGGGGCRTSATGSVSGSAAVGGLLAIALALTRRGRRPSVADS